MYVYVYVYIYIYRYPSEALVFSSSRVPLYHSKGGDRLKQSNLSMILRICFVLD